MEDSADQDRAGRRVQSEKTESRRIRAEYWSGSRAVGDRTDGSNIQDRQGHSTIEVSRGSYRGDGCARPLSYSDPTVKAESPSQVTLSMAKVEEQVSTMQEVPLKMERLLKKLDYEGAIREREVSDMARELLEANAQLQQCRAQLEASRLQTECLVITNQYLHCHIDELRMDKKKLEDILTEQESEFSRLHISQATLDSSDQEIRDQLSDMQQQFTQLEIKMDKRLDRQDTSSHYSSVHLVSSLQVSDTSLEGERLIVGGDKQWLLFMESSDEETSESTSIII